MTQKLETVVFFGSGPVAAASLELLAKHQPIECVVTKPRPAHHKGDVPVLRIAEQLKLPVVEVSTKSELSQKIAEQNFSSQLGVLIDFGIIVRQDVINSFELGIVNSHFSLLPDLRGADPITFSILSGQKQTGVSLMLLVEAMDEGPLLAVEFCELTGKETTPELTEKLIYLSDSLLKGSLTGYMQGKHKVIDQLKISEQITNYPSKPTYSRKLSKSDSIIDLQKPAIQLEREVRAFIEWPKSRTNIADKDVVITKAHIDLNRDKKRPLGAYMHGKELLLQTAEGILVIDELKPAGKAAMNAAGFINGHKTLLTSY